MIKVILENCKELYIIKKTTAMFVVPMVSRNKKNTMLIEKDEETVINEIVVNRNMSPLDGSKLQGIR